MLPDAIYYTEMDSPMGAILLARSSKGLLHIHFQDGDDRLEPRAGWHETREGFDETLAQVRAYFTGELREFDLVLAPEGTPFQLEVWGSLQTIPYGETISYAALAEKIGRPTATRAVGAANGRNPLPIVIPCHRVIGSDGQLTGYAGGIHLKEALLTLEQPGWGKAHEEPGSAEYQMKLL
jgi:methylated-DNA-[protein]-cysteine S-methyltransferase